MQSKDLQIDWLRTFLAVVDSGSMTAAARQVARSQSAVSMQLKKLEDSLGRPMFKREPRQLSLTPAGYDLLGHARKLLEAHSTMVDAMHGGAVSGRVTLGVPDDYAVTYLMPALRSFMTRFGEVEVTLACEDSATLWAKVDRGQIDLALLTRDAPSRGELLFREALVWGGAEQHEAWKRSPLPIAVHGLSDRLRTSILAAITGLGREYRVVYNSPNLSGQLTAMDSGLAVAVVTRCSLPAHLKVLDLRHGLPDLPVAEVVLTRSRDSAGSRAADALYAHIADALRDPLCN
ncbi:LysR family transcriptional regulator [Pseudomonas sp. B21-031]|jgi:DNA-binding transcriptional LysR family regulator|uniref:LysR family transcriptional regulator n=1 Tax=Pseudomonas sp. B21-031 TaxID=2895482 RepID=UPI00215FB3F6|nr:LysR family transcriptional regulator [Pseudomonas sp. B21-031]UVL64819.1 LysR family transcriptional regulator [Pseudomonas sp. B21-031]